ncbi:MAG: hypothetical protein E7379_02735 [Clostridiales bacterium]|nr:hypothetical protein [Clostridiales bacterium]
MNIIEKRKGQLKGLGIGLLVLSLIALAGGIAMMVIACKETVNVGLLIGGILLLISGIAFTIIGIIFTWTGSAVKATQGSIAEENFAKGTVNMHKCSNCGKEIPEDKAICEECEENLKP